MLSQGSEKEKCKMDRFLDFVADVMGVNASDICMETRYKEGKWDSLMMLTLVMELERLGDVETLADLYEFVKQPV